MVPIKGLVLDYPKRNKQLTIFLWQDGERSGQYLAYPSKLPINKEQIKREIVKQLKVSIDEVYWENGIIIPKI